MAGRSKPTSSNPKPATAGKPGMGMGGKAPMQKEHDQQHKGGKMPPKGMKGC